MAESDVAVGDDAQADLDFAQGFESAPPPPAQPAQGDAPVEAKAPEPKPIKTETKDEPAQPAKPEAPPAAPEYVQLTKEEHAILTAAAAKTAGFEAQLSKAFGTIGNMQQIVNKLQSQTPSGEKVEVPKVAFAKLRESFPEVADLLEGDMAEALKGLRGTGPENAPGPVVDQEAINAAAKSITTQLQIEALEDNHPNWRAIVGVDDEGKHDPNNPFRKWLAAQPAEYQTKINETHSAIVISNAIGKFQASTKAAETPSAQPAPKVAARKDRIQAAVQPKGDGGQPPPPKTADDDFAEGFRTG
jgi:hypothetical protein